MLTIRILKIWECIDIDTMCIKYISYTLYNRLYIAYYASNDMIYGRYMLMVAIHVSHTTKVYSEERRWVFNNVWIMYFRNDVGI